MTNFSQRGVSDKLTPPRNPGPRIRFEVRTVKSVGDCECVDVLVGEGWGHAGTLLLSTDAAAALRRRLEGHEEADMPSCKCGASDYTAAYWLVRDTLVRERRAVLDAADSPTVALGIEQLAARIMFEISGRDEDSPAWNMLPQWIASQIRTAFDAAEPHRESEDG